MTAVFDGAGRRQATLCVLKDLAKLGLRLFAAGAARWMVTAINEHGGDFGLDPEGGEGADMRAWVAKEKRE